MTAVAEQSATATATSGPEPTTVTVAGTDVLVRRAGDGPPLLLLHGHWATRSWLPLHAALAERADVVAPTLPGFDDGDEPPAWITGREDVVLLLRDLLDGLRLDRVHLVGYGLGGWLAADLATWFPTRLASLSLLAPFGLRVPDEPIEDVFLMNPERFSEAYGLPEDVMADPELVPGVGTPVHGGPEAWARRYGVMGSAARLMWQRRYDLKLEHRLPRVAATGLASLVVSGADDRVVPSGHPARWAELLGARTATVPGGHAFPLTAPDQTAAAVLDLVQETS